MATCRCHMCGRKSAGRNNVRNDYLRAGVSFDEHALSSPERRRETKRLSHRALRRQAKTDIFEQEMEFHPWDKDQEEFFSLPELECDYCEAPALLADFYCEKHLFMHAEEYYGLGEQKVQYFWYSEEDYERENRLMAVAHILRTQELSASEFDAAMSFAATKIT